MIKNTFIIVFLGTIYQVKAQFVAALSLNQGGGNFKFEKTEHQFGTAGDSSQYILKRAGLFKAYRLYHGGDYIPFTGKPLTKYTPELKSHFAAYPLANQAILQSERYHKSAVISLRTMLVVGTASAIIGFSTINNSRYDSLDLTFDILVISSALTTSYLFHKTAVKKRKAVNLLNAGQ